MRMSAPLALASARLPRPEGTRIMSPKVVSTAPPSASLMAWSMRFGGTVQTGQPGPMRTSTFLGSIDLIPYFVMVSSWVPQTWTILTRRPPASSSMRAQAFLAISLSLKPSTKLNIKGTYQT